MKSAACIIILFLLLVSCNITNQPDTSNYVVEAFLFEGEPVREITVKGIDQFSESSDLGVPISTAEVRLTRNGQQNFDLVYNEVTQKYEYQGNDLDVLVGDTFDLRVRVGDRVSTASTIVPEITDNLVISSDTMIVPVIRLTPGFRDRLAQILQFSRLDVEWDSGDDFHYLVIESRTATIEPLFPDQTPDQLVNALGRFRFITEPTSEGFFEVLGLSLGTYGLHVVKVFRVNQEYVDLFQNTVQDSRDLNEPPSNINNALGIFSAFSSDSVFFDVVRPNQIPE